jgi:aspartate/methionine/tyrosine aminotransferase
LCTPGSAYGKAGEGYIRMALTLADEDPEGRLQEAVERIARAFS